jgi:hypothetical protein
MGGRGSRACVSKKRPVDAEQITYDKFNKGGGAGGGGSQPIQPLGRLLLHVTGRGWTKFVAMIVAQLPLISARDIHHRKPIEARALCARGKAMKRAARLFPYIGLAQLTLITCLTLGLGVPLPHPRPLLPALKAPSLCHW